MVKLVCMQIWKGRYFGKYGSAQKQMEVESGNEGEPFLEMWKTLFESVSPKGVPGTQIPAKVTSQPIFNDGNKNILILTERLTKSCFKIQNEYKVYLEVFSTHRVLLMSV